MAEYDPKVIHEYAQRLYAQSKSVIPAYFFTGLFAGLVIFSGLSSILTYDFDFLIIAIGVMVGGVVGYGAGQSRSCELKLQAQIALCQTKIEQNTSR